MRVLRILTVTAAAAALTVVPTAGASAAPAGASPVATCKQLAEADPEAYAFIATKPGACVSSVASVGVEALMTGAFPSQAAAVGNCKAIEAMVGGYPYAFYGRTDPAYLATNRAGCVRVLRALHSGQLEPGPVT